MKTILTVVILSVLVFAAVLGGRLYHFYQFRSPAEESTLVVMPGTSLRQVSLELAKAGVIEDAYLFELWAKFRNLERRLRAGRYVFPASQTPDQVIDVFSKGEMERQTITIPEGFTMDQVAALVAQKTGDSKDRLLALLKDPAWLKTQVIVAPTAEGYLFPETYAYDPGSSGETLLKRMIETFHARVDPVWTSSTTPPLATLYEVLTLASIVEREARVALERPMIAGVYLNRLRQGIPLQADPTVIYGIPNFNGNLTRADLDAAQPYNTYVTKGLTPTPICNPGLASIQAVLAPASTDAIYFVAKGDGSHQFSKTLEEHNQAVYQYQVAPSRAEP